MMTIRIEDENCVGVYNQSTFFMVATLQKDTCGIGLMDNNLPFFNPLKFLDGTVKCFLCDPQSLRYYKVFFCFLVCHNVKGLHLIHFRAAESFYYR